MKLIFLAAISTTFAQMPEEVAIFEPAPIQMYAPPQMKSSFAAVSLNALIPGLGHAYLGDYATAGGLFGGSMATSAGYSMENMSDTFRTANFVTLQNIWCYGLYAAYRDVRSYNGGVGYNYKMPTDSLADLTTAPFRWSVIKKAQVWGGYLGAMAIAGTIGYLAFPKNQLPTASKVKADDLYPAIALPVGVGEEALFRGFLQSRFSESMPPWASISLSTLLFSAAHIPNAFEMMEEERWRYFAFALPIITGIGAYCGWLTHVNRSLQESVALHTWYDFTLFLAGTLATRANITKSSQFNFSTSF